MKLSVIIPTYQHASTIVGCVDSLLSQTRQPDEIIIIDDGSTDNTQAVLKPHLDKISYHKQENQGSQAARMNGYEKASGDLLMFCDADVVARPDMLEKLENTLKTHSQASYAYPSFKWGSKLFRSQKFDANALKEMNYIHTSALIRKEHFPGFDLTITRFQDWDLWLTMLDQGHTGVFVDEVLYTVVQDKKRLGISNWLPSFAYKIPWSLIGWKPQRIKKYQQGREVIKNKHKL